MAQIFGSLNRATRRTINLKPEYPQSHRKPTSPAGAETSQIRSGPGHSIEPAATLVQFRRSRAETIALYGVSTTATAASFLRRKGSMNGGSQ